MTCLSTILIFASIFYATASGETMEKTKTPAPIENIDKKISLTARKLIVPRRRHLDAQAIMYTVRTSGHCTDVGESIKTETECKEAAAAIGWGPSQKVEMSKQKLSIFQSSIQSPRFFSIQAHDSVK